MQDGEEFVAGHVVELVRGHVEILRTESVCYVVCLAGGNFCIKEEASEC
jgi:hypothetical protein